MFACVDRNWSAALWQHQSMALLAMELYTDMAVSCATRQVQSVADMCKEAEGVVYAGVEKAVAALVASQERSPYRTG